MSYEFYKVLHLFSIFLTLSGLIGLIAIIWNGGAPNSTLRKVLAISHGIGLLLVLVSGFGLAARLGYMAGLPTWIFYKLAIWLCVGGAIALVKRLQKYEKIWYIVTLLLVTTAAFVAVTKPGQ